MKKRNHYGKIKAIYFIDDWKEDEKGNITFDKKNMQPIPDLMDPPPLLPLLLDLALLNEDYEQATVLRDEINRLECHK